MNKNTEKLVAEKIEQIRLLRQRKVDIDETINAKQAEVVSILEENKLVDFGWEDDTGREQITSLRQSTRSKILPFKLKRKIDEDIWKRITIEEIDKEQLNLEVEAGNIPQSVLDECTTTTYGKKFIQ